MQGVCDCIINGCQRFLEQRNEYQLPFGHHAEITLVQVGPRPASRRLQYRPVRACRGPGNEATVCVHPGAAMSNLYNVFPVGG